VRAVGIIALTAALAAGQPMSGVYPVGPGGPGVDSFASVVEAAAALSSRGLAGDADFPIAAGSYVGPVALRSVAGSGSHRTTFRAELQPVTIDAGGARFAFSVESTDKVTLHRLFFAGARDSGSAGLRFVDSDHGHVRSGRPQDSSDVGILALRCDSLRLDSVRIEGDLAGPGSRGVELRDCRWAEVYRCSVPGTVGTGMLVAGGSDVGVYRMTVMDPLTCGLWLDSTVNGTFWRCFNRGAPEYGIRASGATSAYFDSCTSTGATLAAAWFDRCDSLVYRIPMIVGNPQRALWLSRSAACSVRVLTIMGQPAVGMFLDRSPGCVVESTQVMGIQTDTGVGVLIDSCPGSSFTYTQMTGSFERGIVVRRSDRVRLHHTRVRGMIGDAALAIENSSAVTVLTCSLSVVAGVGGAAGALVTGDCADDSLLAMTVLAEAEHGILARGSGVRDPVVANCFLWGWTGNGVLLDGATGPRLYHNTIVGPEGPGTGARFRGVTGARARDNVIWSRGPDSSYCYRVENGFPFGAGASDYNDLHVSGGGALARVGDTVFTGLADWRQHGSGPDAYSLSADPGFDSLGDFHIAATSPCRDAGEPVPGIAADLDGDPRDPVAPDIGADEYGGGAVLEPTRPPAPVAVELLGNPAPGRCRVRYSLARENDVRVRLIDVAGRVVLELAPGRRDAGVHEETLELAGIASGVLVLELRAGRHVTTRKLVRR